MITTLETRQNIVLMTNVKDAALSTIPSLILCFAWWYGWTYFGMRWEVVLPIVAFFIVVFLNKKGKDGELYLLTAAKALLFAVLFGIVELHICGYFKGNDPIFEKMPGWLIGVILISGIGVVFILDQISSGNSDNWMFGLLLSTVIYPVFPFICIWIVTIVTMFSQGNFGSAVMLIIGTLIVCGILAGMRGAPLLLLLFYSATWKALLTGFLAGVVFLFAAKCINLLKTEHDNDEQISQRFSPLLFMNFAIPSFLLLLINTKIELFKHITFLETDNLWFHPVTLPDWFYPVLFALFCVAVYLLGVFLVFKLSLPLIHRISLASATEFKKSDYLVNPQKVYCQEHHSRPHLHNDIFPYRNISCRVSGCSHQFITGIREVVGVIGMTGEWHYVEGEKVYVSIWDNNRKKARVADIDRIEIHASKGGGNYDWAINSVINAFRNDTYRTENYLKKVSVTVHDGAPLSENEFRIIRNEFAGITV